MKEYMAQKKAPGSENWKQLGDVGNLKYVKFCIDMEKRYHQENEYRILMRHVSRWRERKTRQD